MGFGRRTLFTSMGAMAAGHALMGELIGAENNPAAQVADRTSSIRITGIKTIPVQRKIFVRIDTNHGVSGWGEVEQLERHSAMALIQSIFELLHGENPTRIEYLWQKLFRSHRDLRGGPYMVHTLSGIDMALWDLTGKLWGVPVHRMLGGPTRDKIRVYPSPTAVKPGCGTPTEFTATPGEIQRWVDYIQGERKRVGPDGVVIFDAHCAMPPPFLIQLASALKPSDVIFLEEVAVPGNIEVFKRLKQSITIPLATGERDRTIWEFIPYLQERCIDVLQPDCAHCGGISQMKKIAVLAEAYHVPLAPHCITTDLGASASLHVAASIPFFIIHEYYPNHTPEGSMTKKWTVDKDGYASIPDGPGLGVDINEAKLEELSKQPYQAEWPTRGRLKDGSISDY
jgi:galactonate dehydratase